MGACDTALAARKEESSLCKLGLDYSQERVSSLTQQNESKDRQLRAFYRNPFFMFAIGALVGGVAIGFATK